MRLKDFKPALLVAMLRYQRETGLNRYFEPRDAATAHGLEFEPGQIRLCVTEFEARGLVKGAFTLGGGEDGGFHCALTAAGIEAAEEIDDSEPQIFARKRYMAATDHSTEIDQFRIRVGELRQLVQDSRANDFEDKEGRLGEIIALELLVSRPQISVPLIEGILKDTVRYLAQKFANQAIGITAGAVLALAASTFGIAIPH